MCIYIQVKSLVFSQELFDVGTQRILMKIYPLFIQFILYIYSLFQREIYALIVYHHHVFTLSLAT